MGDQMNATITKRQEINHGLLVLQVTPDAELSPFKAGQYTVLGMQGSAARSPHAEPEEPQADPEKLIKRAYSIASSSLGGEYLEFYVALVRTGALTPRLFAAKEGDRVWLGPKVVGMFTLDDVRPDNDLVLVATGTGMAPYLSMLRSAYEFDANRTTIVCHAARVSWDLGYRADLEGLEARYPNFHYLPIIDEHDRDTKWTGEVGYVSRFVTEGTIADRLGHDFDPTRTSVFLCGNPLMIDSMMELLTERGFTKHTRRNPGTLFVEEYWK
ncbi:MAG: ferredoxin--NADP reductase [bacterium]|nr:ferredoxin--NADP reductase [bacterium]